MSVWFYVATKPCGCTVAGCVDDPAYRKDNAKEIARWIREGYKVDRLPEEDGRTMLKSCKCQPKADPSAHLGHAGSE